VFVLTCILKEFFKGALARRELHGGNFVEEVASLTWHNKRRYGGYIVHIGTVLIFAGIAGSQAYGVHDQKHLKIGESIKLRNYTVTYEKLTAVEATSVKTRVIAELGVYRDNKRVWTGRPEKEFYKGQNQPVSEVDVLSSIVEDVYLILADFREDESATIKVYLNPMVSWLWTGGWVIAFGTMVCMWPDRLEQRRRLTRMKKQETLFAPAQE
jgi:cytochrome c-type biogenesis protein CcmF